MRHTLTTVVIAALFAAATQAQTESTKAPVPHQQVISTNPLGVIVKWFNVEYERKITPATTWGVAASTFCFLAQGSRSATRGSSGRSGMRA